MSGALNQTLMTSGFARSLFLTPFLGFASHDVVPVHFVSREPVKFWTMKEFAGRGVHEVLIAVTRPPSCALSRAYGRPWWRRVSGLFQGLSVRQVLRRHLTRTRIL